MSSSSPLSPWWPRAAAVVLLFGFAVLSVMTFNTYRHAPPIPGKVVDEHGAVLFTEQQVLAGQEVFLQHGLMEHGTLWGHGAYLGPDYGSNYLHREAEITRETIATQRYGRPFAKLDSLERAGVEELTRTTLKANRFDAASSTLAYTDGEAESFRRQQQEWSDYFNGSNPAPGLPAGFISDQTQVQNLTAFFSWASWASRAVRPGTDASYTNNWPYDPTAGNTASSSAILWSAISLIFLLGGLGAALFAMGRFDFLGWQSKDRVRAATESPMRNWKLTRSQKATGLYFVVVVLLFLLQVLSGGALAHYRVEPNGFYGFDLAAFLPYNLLRTWHLQLAVFWIATAWVAGGLFLAPMIGGHEPKHQHIGVYALLGALAIVVFGSLGGEYLGVHGMLGDVWFWFGHQGLEYLDLGRFWQVLLAAGLVFWLFLLVRAIAPALKGGKKATTLPALFLYASIAVVVFYLPAFAIGKHTNFAITDNWRFWIIHLWVEGFFELFATVLVAVMFTHMGLVSTRNATRVVYLDAILYLAAGIGGTAHHWYFTGQTTMAMAIGACFSALEVVPLTLLTLDAYQFIRLRRSHQVDGGIDLASGQKWAIRFLIAVGVWNFIGAGVFGFLINLPIVSYYEMGTLLTPNHGHAAMFGVFGMLALSVLVYSLRAMQSDHVWARTEKWISVGYWGLNAGLILMLALSLFPNGVLQLMEVVNHGYWSARQPEFVFTGLFHKLEWLRIIGDVTFIVVGVLPITWAAIRSYVKRDLAPGDRISTPGNEPELVPEPAE